MKNAATIARSASTRFTRGAVSLLDDRIEIVRVGSRLVASNAKRFGRSMLRLLQHRSAVLCIIDMSDVEVVDSSGFGSLISAVRKVEEAGGAAAVVCTNPTVRRLFEVAGVTRIVPVVPHLADARTILEAFDRDELAS
jgi:stage II sporulation protein AA (anti-sigma F factor antagonist)